MKLKDIELVEPPHLKQVSDGHGEFPNSYKLTEKGILLLQEFGKQCFNAGKSVGDNNGYVIGFHDGFNASSEECEEFNTENTFEDYLKSLEE